MSFLLTILILCLALNNLSEAKNGEKLPSAIVVGTVYCDTCFQVEFSKPTHFISGASVAVECGGTTSSSPSFYKEVKTDDHGEFKVSLPFSVTKHVKNIKRCSVKLVSSNEPYCSVSSTATSSSLHLKSIKKGIQIFSAGFFTFKPLKQPEICNQKPSFFKNSKKLINSFKSSLPRPYYDSKFSFLPPKDKQSFPSLPQFPPMPSLHGLLNIPQVPKMTKRSKTIKTTQKLDQKPLFPFPPPTFPIPLPPNPFFQPPSIFPPNPFQPPSIFPPNPFQPPSIFPPNPFQPPPSILPPNPFQPQPSILPPNPFQPQPPPSILPPNPFQPQPPPSILPPNPFQPQPPPSILPPNPFQPLPSSIFPPNPFQPSPPSPGIKFPPIPFLTPSPPPPPPPFSLPFPPFPFPFPPVPGLPGNPPPP